MRITMYESRLPVDIYQTAKVSKILLMMEKRNVPVEYSGKSLAEIDMNPQSLYAEIEDKDNNGKYYLKIKLF